MAKKIEEDDQFLDLRTRLYDVRSIIYPNNRYYRSWGDIEVLKDKDYVKIQRETLNLLLKEIEESNELRATLFKFLRVEEYVASETEFLATKEEDY